MSLHQYIYAFFNKSRSACLFFIILILLFFSVSSSYSQPGTYYSSIVTSNVTFITDLQSRVRNPYTRVSYDNFDETNIAGFASINNWNGTRSLFCVYTGYEHIYTGVFLWGTMSREHTWAHSWAATFPSENTDQYSDQHNLFPAHQNNANNRRNNHPFGKVVNITYQFLQGKLGTNSSGQIVYEPKDDDKGDAVRALLYMSVRYDGINGHSWNFNWLNNTRLPSLGEQPQDTNVLINWHKQDPPDKWEVDRNNYVQTIQLNRNPFVDHPEYVNFINFNNLTKLNPEYSAEPSDHVSNFTSLVSENNILLNWNDASGSQLPSGYLLVAYNKNNFFLPIDGCIYNNDPDLSDGFAVVSVDYANINSYTFNNLPANSSYYFTMYSYNGSSTMINYKIDGTFSQTNSVIPGIFAPEPANCVSNFNASNITATSVKLNWIDADPGTQIPSGYLLLAGNDSIFNDPSDGITYFDDLNLSDGNAVLNIDYSSSDEHEFVGLFSNTPYYFKIYSYNGTGKEINYKTNGIIPFVSAITLASSSTISLLDNFNRINNSILGNTLLPQGISWVESETVIPSSISLSDNHAKFSSTIAGRELALINIGSIKGYPQQFSSSENELIWAINMKQSRTDPSGFDANNYGMAFILGKATPDINSGNGYAVVIGQGGSNDAVRLTKFTGGVNANNKFTDIISSGDYSNKYLSIKIIYQPSESMWSLLVDSSSIAFPQTDPRNTLTQIGTSFDTSYTSISLPYLGTLWNHVTSANDSAIFDDLFVPGVSITTLQITALMEGYLQNGMLAKKDTLKVYLRSPDTPFTVVDSAKSVLDSLLFNGFFNMCSAPAGEYYIVVKHRNSIETWSKTPQNFETGVTSYYDFSISRNKAYGDNLILKNGKYCIYSGDVNQDGIIDASDISNVDNDVFVSAAGYIRTDLNGDDFVDAADLSIVDNNSLNSVGSITP